MEEEEHHATINQRKDKSNGWRERGSQGKTGFGRKGEGKKEAREGSKREVRRKGESLECNMVGRKGRMFGIKRHNGWRERGSVGKTGFGRKGEGKKENRSKREGKWKGESLECNTVKRKGRVFGRMEVRLEGKGKMIGRKEVRLESEGKDIRKRGSKVEREGKDVLGERK